MILQFRMYPMINTDFISPSVQVKIWFQNRRTKWKKQNPGMDVNCGTLPSPPTSLCPPYPSLFPHPPSPTDLGFYSAAAAHHSAFPFIAAAAASSAAAGNQINPVVSQPSQMSNTLGKLILKSKYLNWCKIKNQQSPIYIVNFRWLT